MSLEDSTSDRDLAQRVSQSGDERAFRILYRRHTPRLYGVLARSGGTSTQEAEDWVQETWVRAVEGLPRFRWDAAFSTWLVAIGLNVLRDALRKNGRRMEDTWDETLDPPVRAAPVGERVDLERALRALPHGMRTVLVLHDVEGWAHESIAERLGITAGTSKSQLHRARKALRAWFGIQPEGSGA